MKTKHYILLSATMIAAVLAGCQRKTGTEPETSEAVEKTFYGSTVGGEKTTLASDFNTLWTEGDAIGVTAGGASGQGKGDYFTLTTGAGTSYGEFSGSTAATGPYVAAYPYSFINNVWSNTVQILLPDEQSITEAGTFASGTVPMVAYSENDFLNFKNVGSLFCLSLKTVSGNKPLSRIELEGNDGEHLSGYFQINASDSQPKAVYNSWGRTVLTVYCSNITLNETTPTNLYIFVPAGVFAKGFTAVVYDTDYRFSVISTSQNFTTEVSKGQIYSADVDNFDYCRNCEYKETLDYCGYRYNLVTIAGKTWFAENLRCATYSDGTAIPTAEEWEQQKEEHPEVQNEYGPYYRNNFEYGYLYSWAAAMKYTHEEAWSQDGLYDGVRQGICPEGFHLPSRQEYEDLIAVTGRLDGYTAQHLKGCLSWDSHEWPGGNGDNIYCFSALAAGSCYGTKEYTAQGVYGFFWTTDAGIQDDAPEGVTGHEWAYYGGANYDSGYFYTCPETKRGGRSVRCVKN